jgi:hypothetical protein
MWVVHEVVNDKVGDWCDEFNSKCACRTCHPVNFCVDDPCHHCEGPAKQICDPPEEGE